MTCQHGRNAVQKAVEATREHECSNGHSWGWAAWFPDSGELRIQKGVGHIPAVHRPPTGATLAIGHTRYATKGLITQGNAHPFAVRNEEDEIVAALCHNGTWYGAEDHEFKSDSRLMAEYLEELLHYCTMEEAVKRVANRCGETILVLTREGKCYAYSGRFTITYDASEPAVASSGYNPIPDGDILAVDATEAELTRV